VVDKRAMGIKHLKTYQKSLLGAGERFIFVGGAPRSGTTLLQNILDSHPKICGGPEFLHLPDIVTLRAKIRQDIDRGWIDRYCSSKSLDELICGLIEQFLLPLADSRQCNFLSEKTPENVLVFSDLMAMLSGARFLHVIRDPRGTIASMLQVGRRAKEKNIKMTGYTSTLNDAILFVKRCLDAGFNASKSSPDRVLTVQYEKLTSYPENESRRICDFLGVAWSSRMLSPANYNHLGQEAITKNSGEIWYDSASYNRDPHTESIEKWKRDLSPAAQVAITDFFKTNQDLVQLGYDFSLGELPKVTYLIGKLHNTVCRLRKTTFYRVRSLARRLQ